MAAPSVPTGLTVTAGLNELILNWSASTGTLDNYNIFSGTSAGTEALAPIGISSGTAVTFTDTPLTNGVTRFYKVSAIFGTEESALSDEANGTVFYVPNEPTDVNAVGGYQEIVLTWIAPVNTGGTPITGYEIFLTGSLVPLITVGTVLTWTDTGLGDGETREYHVVAVNVVGEGSDSLDADAATWTVPDTITDLAAVGGLNEITLTWTSPGETGTEITIYSIYSGTTAGTVTTLIGTTARLTTTAIEAVVGAGITRYYKVTASNIVGEGVKSNVASGTTFGLPGAPTSIALEPGDGQIYIESWVAPVSTGGSSITGYKIYRGTSALAVNTLVNTVSSTIVPYLDDGLTNGAIYYYKISAITAIGEGPKSVESHGLVTNALVSLLNEHMYNVESLREFVFDLTGASSYTIPLSTSFLILAMIPSFSTATNVTAVHDIVVNKTLKTVTVYDASGVSPLEFSITLLVVCRDKLFQNDN